jgi:hypothetical protein
MHWGFFNEFLELYLFLAFFGMAIFVVRYFLGCII